MKLYFFENESEMDLYVVPAKTKKEAIEMMRRDMGEMIDGKLVSDFRRKDWKVWTYFLDQGPIRFAMCAGD